MLLLALQFTLFSIISPMGLVHASELSDDLSSMTKDERVALENIEVSENLQNMANNFSEGVRPELTDNDRVALKLLGYSDAEIDNLSLATIQDEGERDKFTNRLGRYANKKGNEIETGVTQDLVPGLASAVIGLAFASLLGVVVGVRCYNQPSALAFAATSGAWVALEMMIWSGYQIRMKDIETLQNATKIPEYVDKKIAKVRKIIESLERDFKAQNLSDFEAFLESKSSEIDELKAIAKEVRSYLKTAKDRQFGALRSLQESIVLAAETSKKKARNAKVAAIGYTASAGLAAAEGFNLFSGGGKCMVGNQQTLLMDKNPTSLLGMALWKLLPSAQAGFASIGDLDKIGIPLGGGLAAAYLGFEKKFADKIFESAIGRGVIFLAMAGLAYLASTKLEKASQFLEKQANEMDIFVTSVEEKLSTLNASFPDGAELIRELKENLLPEIQEIAQSLKDKEEELKNRLIEEGSSQLANLNDQQIKDLINAEEKFSLSDIEKSLNSLPSAPMSDLDSSDFSGKLTTWNMLIDSLIVSAYASPRKFTNQTPLSCFQRTRTYLLADEDCSCRAQNRCMKSQYPNNIKMKQKTEFGFFSYKMGSLVSQSSDYIFHGQAMNGLKGFSKAGNLTAKMDLNTRKFLSQKMGKKIDNKVTAKMIAGAFDTIKPGLKDYFKGNKSVARLSPQISSNYIKTNRGKLVSPKQERNALRASLQKRLQFAKSLGNKSLLGFSPSSNNTEKKEIYDYSKESITRDASKNIFQVIKKRYLIIQSQGRLKL